MVVPKRVPGLLGLPRYGLRASLGGAAAQCDALLNGELARVAAAVDEVAGEQCACMKNALVAAAFAYGDEAGGLLQAGASAESLAAFSNSAACAAHPSRCDRIMSQLSEGCGAIRAPFSFASQGCRRAKANERGATCHCTPSVMGCILTCIKCT